MHTETIVYSREGGNTPNVALWSLCGLNGASGFDCVTLDKAY